MPQLMSAMARGRFLKYATSASAAPFMTNANIFDGKSDKLAMSISVLVEGNPLENLDLVTDPGKNFAVIMKDSKIYKNAL